MWILLLKGEVIQQVCWILHDNRGYIVQNDTYIHWSSIPAALALEKKGTKKLSSTDCKGEQKQGH